MGIQVNDVDPRVQYVPIAAQVVFTIPFEFFEDADIKIYFDDNTVAESAGFTIVGANSNGTKEVTFAVAPETNAVAKLTIERDTQVKRTTNFTVSADWTPANINNEYNRITMMVGEREGEVLRSVTRPVQSAETYSLNWPEGATAAGKVLLVTTSGLTLESAGSIGVITLPASSTDNAVPRWNGVGGDSFQDSLVTIDDEGRMEVGDPGFEAGGINIGGVVYTTQHTINDIGGANPAQFLIHRHSTTLPAVSVGSRTNNDTVNHSAVTNGMSLWQMIAAGYTGAEYNLFGGILFSVDDTGTVDDTSSPGKIEFQVTPDAGVVPVTFMTVTNDGKVAFSNAMSALTLDTGQGANELYGMDQDVQTGDAPIFAGLSFTGNLLAGNAAGPAVVNEGVSVTNPVFCPDRADLTTGWGGADGGGNLAAIVGGAQAQTINNDGSVTNALQPSFLVTRNGASNNVTGNGTVFTLELVSEVFDVGDNWSTITFTYTFPVSGKWSLSARTGFSGVTAAADQASLAIITSNRTHTSTIINTNDLDETNSMIVSGTFDADVSDTATVTLTVSGEASDIVDVIGLITDLQTHFSGHLLS